MKTPDEIKKGLEECTFRDGRECDVCPFHDYEYCYCELQKNALTYIQQLENHIGELTEKVTQLEAAHRKG